MGRVGQWVVTDLEKLRGLLALHMHEHESARENKNVESGEEVRGSWPEREELRTFWKLTGQLL